MFVKFCGFTRIEDVRCAVELGVSAIGFIFYRGSRRCVDPSTAKLIGAPARDRGVRTVGVFVDTPAGKIIETCDRAGIDMVQCFDGDIAEELRGKRPVIRVLRVSDASDLAGVMPPRENELLLLDSFSRTAPGGTGTAFNRSVLRGFPLLDKSIIAGGLSAATLPVLLSRYAPYGLDVSSGIEVSPGIKSPAKMREFINACREVHNAELHPSR